VIRKASRVAKISHDGVAFEEVEVAIDDCWDFLERVYLFVFFGAGCALHDIHGDGFVWDIVGLEEVGDGLAERGIFVVIIFQGGGEKKSE